MEKQNLAVAHPDIVQKIEGIMASEHTPSPHYDAPEQSQKDKKKAGGKRKVKSVSDMLNEEDSAPEGGKK
jgi:hypothetical protein